MIAAAGALLRRELRLSLVDGGAIGTALGFYLIVVTLIPLGLGPDLKLLARIAPGVLWIGVLLAALLSLGRLFEADVDDGSLDVLALASLPLEVTVWIKCFAHWLSTGLPLVLVTPFLGLMLDLDLSVAPVLMATLTIGTPAISYIGAIGAALTVRADRSGLLVALLVLPLYIPTLIFGISTISAIVIPPGDPWASLALLAATSLASLVLAPVAAAAALRLQRR